MASRNKCSGCSQVIDGSTKHLRRHEAGCTQYQTKYGGVPDSTDGALHAAAERGGLLSGLQKLTTDLRRKKKKKKKTSVQTGVEDGDATPSAPTSDPLALQDNDYMMQVDNEYEQPQETLSCTPPPQAELVEEPVQPVDANGRPVRNNRGHLPARFVQNMLPVGPTPLPEPNETPSAQKAPPPIPIRFRPLGQLREVRRRLSDTVRTTANKFGLSRLYYGRPSSVPDSFEPMEKLLDSGSQESPPQEAAPDRTAAEAAAAAAAPKPRPTLLEAIAPYPNYSAWLYGKHHWDQATKSKGDRRKMQTNLFANPLFNSKDVAFVDFDAIDQKLSRSTNDSFSHGLDDRFGRGWKTSTISVDVPHGVKKKEGKSQKNAAPRPTAEQCRFDVPGVLHRSIPDVVCDAFKQPSGKSFHYTPFREYWERPDTKTTENVYGQFYSSAAFIEAHDELQKSAPEPDCSLPRAVAGIFMASDCAHLTDTGTAKIHPFNVLIANNDKYENGKPKSHAVHPVMVLPPLPDTIHGFVDKLYNGKTKAPDNPIFTHCRREYYHGGLHLLFDADFWRMYRHGRVVECADGVTRRLYLRLFLYSADYPEKVLLATIRDGGGCPCPQCLVKHAEMHKMGTKEDMETRRSNIRNDDATRQAKVNAARKIIYEKGYAVNNEQVDGFLKEESYVPTENALSVTMEGVKINVFSLLVVDLMHEIELGVWIGLLAHLIRILHTLGHDKVQALNERFHAIPTFGRDAIRSFSAKVADMSRMTADDYANMLQCAMPCFEGLFPEPYDSEIQSLLFTLARWHSLAKLRMHTDSTLKQLEQVTTDFGIAIRNFQTGCCEKLEAYETPKEQEKRVRTAQAAASTQKTTQTVVNTSRQVKKYNLNTIKFHSMPDYVPSITCFGTTDGYTTAINELSHRVPISMFQRTSKRNFESQIVNQLSIREAHDEIEARLKELETDGESMFALVEKSRKSDSKGKKRSDDDGPVVGNGIEHYHVAEDERDAIYLSKWERDHAGDQAYEGFTERLRDHCLAQLWKKRGISDQIPDDGRYPEIERDELHIVDNRIYAHARIHFNYTTYDVRRGQDCLTCNSRKRDVMLLSDDTESSDAMRHAFWSARILNIFHVYVAHPILTSRPTRIDLLWVRWFGMDPDYHGGWVHRRLDRIGFVPSHDPDAFGFLDPAKVLRACHLIPAFALGHTKELLAPSSARDSKDEGDWVNYYVGRFSDRDIMMRYTGLGVGHAGNIPVCIDRTEPALFEELEPSAAEVAIPGSSASTAPASSTTAPSTLATDSATPTGTRGPADDVEMSDGAPPNLEEWLPWHVDSAQVDA